MSPIRKRNLAVAGAITAALLAGGAGVAVASTDEPTNQTAPAEQAEGNEGAEGPEGNEGAEGPEGDEANEGPEGSEGDEGDEGEVLNGTVPAPADNAAEESGTEDEAAEAAALAPLATVSEADATAAALAAVPGTAGTVLLEDENGFVVWAVEVTADDGTITEVTIDAGDASVLAQETEEGGETNDD